MTNKFEIGDRVVDITDKSGTVRGKVIDTWCLPNNDPHIKVHWDSQAATNPYADPTTNRFWPENNFVLEAKYEEPPVNKFKVGDRVADITSSKKNAGEVIDSKVGLIKVKWDNDSYDPFTNSFWSVDDFILESDYKETPMNKFKVGDRVVDALSNKENEERGTVKATKIDAYHGAMVQVLWDDEDGNAIAGSHFNQFWPEGDFILESEYDVNNGATLGEILERALKDATPAPTERDDDRFMQGTRAVRTVTETREFSAYPEWVNHALLGNKIQAIKALRYLTFHNDTDIGLAKAKIIVENMMSFVEVKKEYK